MAVSGSSSTRESHFSPEELFFSTTDRKGFINFGNQVFVRVSRYPECELLGQPHNIIRHPDMPHCVFRLLWGTILQGKPIAAYVKNMAKDGSFYWVLAFVAPIPDGFLSIRLKPSGPLFEQVRRVYEELRAVEQQADDAGLTRAKSMDAADEKLGAILKSLEIADYDHLMNEILVSEVMARKAAIRKSDAPGISTGNSRDELGRRRQHCARLGQHMQRLNDTLHSFLELEKSLAESMRFAFSFGRTLHRFTLNGQILAASLGEQGAALREVAREMNVVSLEVDGAGQKLGRTMSDVMGELKKASAEISASDLSVEMMSNFLAELQSDNDNAQAMTRNIDNLGAVIADRFRSTCDSTERAANALDAFQKIVDDFVSTVQILDILYVSGRIEAVRQTGAEGFGEVLCELVAAVAEARKHADMLSGLVSRVQSQLLKESANQRHMVESLA